MDMLTFVTSTLMINMQMKMQKIKYFKYTTFFLFLYGLIKRKISSLKI